MTTNEKAREMLRDLEAQLVYFEEQATLARGAVQTLRHLLANSEDGTNEIHDDTADPVAG